MSHGAGSIAARLTVRKAAATLPLAREVRYISLLHHSEPHIGAGCVGGPMIRLRPRALSSHNDRLEAWALRFASPSDRRLGFGAIPAFSPWISRIGNTVRALAIRGRQFCRAPRSARFACSLSHSTGPRRACDHPGQSSEVAVKAKEAIGLNFLERIIAN